MKVRNIETGLLRTFLTIYETRNFTKSAEILLRSQSAITMQMQRLEDILGCKLTYKNKRHIEITEEGLTLLPYAQEILQLNDEVQKKLDLTQSNNEIRVGTSDDYAVMLLPDILDRFALENPNVSINTICANRDSNLELFHKGELDILLIPTRVNENIGETVRSERLLWVGNSETEIDGNASIPLAGFPVGCLCRDLMIKALNKCHRKWNFLYSSNSVISLHSAIRSRGMITAMEESTVPNDIKILDGKFSLPTLPDVKLTAFKNKHTDTRATHRFYDYLMDNLRVSS